MVVLGFVESSTWLVMIISGLIGILYSGEKVLSFLPFFGSTEDRNTAIMKYLSIIMGVFVSVWMALLILDDVAQFRWLTIVLLAAFMIVSLAHPVRSLEGWKVIILAVPFVAVAILAFWFKNDKQFTIFGSEISLWLILTIVAVVMLILFVLVFFIEETFVDPVLWILGWAPLKIAVSLLVILHGILLFFTPIDGFLAVLGDVST